VFVVGLGLGEFVNLGLELFKKDYRIVRKKKKEVLWCFRGCMKFVNSLHEQ